MSTQTTKEMENKVDDGRKLWPTKWDYIHFFSLIILFAIVFSVTTFVTPTQQPMRSSDCHHLSYPMETSNFNWNIFLLVISSLMFFSTISWIEVVSKPKSNYDHPDSPLGNRCIEFSRLILTLGNGLMISILVAVISSYAEGILAPNFIAACGLKEDDIHRICNLSAFLTSSVQCSTRSRVWVPARSSSPSTNATIQAFLMISLALYAHYRMKEPAARRYLKFVLQLLALVFIWASGYAVVKRNEANWIAVVIGYLIGIIVALLTITFARKWLQWVTKVEPVLPYYWKDEDIKVSQEVSLPSTPPSELEKTFANDQLKPQINPEMDSISTSPFSHSPPRQTAESSPNNDYNPLIEY